MLLGTGRDNRKGPPAIEGWQGRQRRVRVSNPGGVVRRAAQSSADADLKMVLELLANFLSVSHARMPGDVAA